MGIPAPHHVKAAPLGGTLRTPAFTIAAGLAALAGILILARFVLGLGATTAMNDGYPWGLWIAWDVVVGTALSTGGYAMAILVYVANRGRYHPLVRSALVISALGYTLAGLSVVIDLGRWWSVWKVPVSPTRWNLESVLLEVALCIMLYTAVLWIEAAPALLSRWRTHAAPARLRAFAERATPVLERAMPWVIALGVLLPTMHQSSLGSLMLLAGHKLHPLWQTPFLPLLFLLSSIAMGYAAVVIESTLVTGNHGLRREVEMLRGLRPAATIALGGFWVVRLMDIAWRGELRSLAALDGSTALFLAEMALLAVPLVLFARGRGDERTLFRGALFLVAGGALYRFSTFLIAFDPAQGWRYFPSVIELVVTLGIIGFEVAAYLYIVKRFPILASRPAPRPSVSLPPHGLPGVPAAGDLRPASSTQPR